MTGPFMRGIALFQGSLLVACSLQAAPLIAADELNLDLLLFDPVPLVIVQDAGAESAVTAAAQPPYQQ